MAIAPYITARISSYLSAHNTGLGNVLFQIASVYGLAKLTNRPVSFHMLNELGKILKDRFGYDHENTIFREFSTTVCSNESWLELCETSNSHYAFDSTLVNSICGDKNYLLNGYFEHVGYFKNEADEIRKRLQPDTNSYKLLKERHSYLFENRNTVSVHFRLNEYTSYNNWSYYERAICYAKQNIKDPLFIIFTDNASSVDLKKVGLEGSIIMANEVDYLDLWAMSLCKHNITSFSTFCFWAVFLNENPDKIVITDKSYSHKGWYDNAVEV